MITNELVNTVTLSAIVGNTSSLPATIRAMEYSIKDIPFQNVQILSCVKFSHPKIKYIPIHNMTYTQYNNFIIRQYNDFIDSDFVINIQDDGFIINADAWSNEFLTYDYIGALWPIGLGDCNPNKKLLGPNNQTIDIPYVTQFTRCGNGGFTLRSKKFLSISQKYCPTLDYNEDAVVCRIYKDVFVSHGIKYAPDHVAAKFAIEFNVPETLALGQYSHDRNTIKTFGFHGKHCDAINYIK